MASSSDVNKLMRRCRKAGLDVEHLRNHWRVTNRLTGAFTTVSVSPSRVSWQPKAHHDLKAIGMEI